MDQTALPKPKPQGVILVTEHNAEVNAGFAVLRGSNHAPPLREEDWQRIPLHSGESHEPVIGEYRKKLVDAYWKLVSTMVSNGRDDRDMTPSECQAWIQTGLALTPFCGHAMDTSLDWAVAWSLIGNGRLALFSCPLKENGRDRDTQKISYHHMTSGLYPCSRGLELALSKDHFPHCLLFLGMPPYWSFRAMACSKRSELLMANVAQ